MRLQLGRVVDVHPGDDFIIRVVSVKTAQGIVKRNTTTICPLPFHLRLRSANVLLEKINDIDAECSEDDQEILDIEIDNTENYDPLETDSNTDENEENISNVCRR
ncbi:hypothetical protein M0802_010755 [Mischocyttarus mexicanus]|nr:hypothetical protein M0802_010755 [Mischocyttarus mexicanus]